MVQAGVDTTKAQKNYEVKKAATNTREMMRLRKEAESYQVSYNSAKRVLFRARKELAVAKALALKVQSRAAQEEIALKQAYALDAKVAAHLAKRKSNAAWRVVLKQSRLEAAGRAKVRARISS